MAKRLIILAVVVAAVVSAALAANAARARLSREKIAELEPRLLSEDSEASLAAALSILKINPRHKAARVAWVRSLVDQGRRAEAREVLAGLESDPSMALTNMSAELEAETYLDEADELLLGTRPTKVESIEDSIESLLDEAASLRRQMTPRPDDEAARLTLEARENDTRATLVWKQLQASRIELSKSQSVHFLERVDSLVADIKELEQRLAALESSARELATVTLAKHPKEIDPRLVMFHSHLRKDEEAEARAAALAIAAQPNVARSDAGEVADTLLNLDRFFARQTSRADVDAARRLLAHAGLTGKGSIRFELARASLAVFENKPDAAEAILQRVLVEYPGNPRATCLLATIMTREGRPRDAIAMIEPFNLRTHLPEGLAVLGLARLAAGEKEAGEGALRESLDAEPDNLPVQLELVRVLLKSDHVGDAAPYINAAMALNPSDFRVKAFRAALLVGQRSRTGLAEILRDYPKASPLNWRHAALAAAMVLDDAAKAKRFAEALRARRNDDPLVLVADAWSVAAPRGRYEVSALAARTMLEQVDADPLWWPIQPDAALLEFAPDTAAGSKPPITAAVQADALRRPHFVPLPQETASTLVKTALTYWPGQAELLNISAELSLQLGEAATPAAGAEAAASSMTPQWLALSRSVKSGDKPVIMAALKAILAEHPWNEPALLLVLRGASARKDVATVKEALAIAAEANAQLAALTRSRVLLADGVPGDAIHDAGEILHHEDPDTELRAQAAGVWACANLVMRQTEVAGGAIESLALSTPDRRMEMQLASIDFLLMTSGERAAAASLATLLANDQTPRELDQLLIRARRVMAPQRFGPLVDRLLENQPDNAVLMVHKAYSLADQGNLAAADAVARRAYELRPEAPRVKMLRARLAAQGGRSEEASKLCAELVDEGVMSEARAREAMERYSKVAALPAANPQTQGAER